MLYNNVKIKRETNSTSATVVAEINEEECEQVGLSPTAGSSASERGAFFDMMVM